MDKTKERGLKLSRAGLLLRIAGPWLVVFVVLGTLAASAQRETRPTLPEGATGPASPHRTRLILKDGSYQVVMSYKIVGERVRFVSAERGGATEEIPLALIDLDATHKWEIQHDPEHPEAQAPVLDPELLKEEADRAARTPLVAPDLHLPEQGSVFLLDTFRGTMELVPMAQSAGDLNRNTAHNILRAAVNPMATSHQIVQLKGTSAAVQLHVDTPVLYIRVGDDAGVPTGGSPLTVDTHGASGQAPTAATGGAATSKYVIVRTDVRTDARVVASFNTNMLGNVRQQEDVIETGTELLPGGHWMKLTSHQPLLFGEYALMEVISPKEINLDVWDFGVHPTAAENRDVIKPEAKRPLSLERRRRD